MKHNWRWKVYWAISLALAVSEPGFARPVPDNTLGNRRSQVIDRSARDFDIDGGARREANLFHSFSDFNVEDGGSVYFVNPNGVGNIFSRVTGSSPSNILGRLGVRGSANLFLINPNGIVFGSGASLDLQGSFLATTANALQFGEQGLFSATNPEAPALLTINPSALLFNQIPVGNIVNNSTAPAGFNNLGAAQFGLRVPDGESLLLVGGDITMNSGRLNALGGRIELAGLSNLGQINLVSTADDFRLSIPANAPLSNISAFDNAFINTAGTKGGEIVVSSSALNLVNGSQLSTATAGSGDGGDIMVNADQVNLLGAGAVGANGTRQTSGLFSSTFAAGNAGDIVVNASQVKLENGGQISAPSSGSGRAGSITITADTIELIGIAEGRVRSGLVSETANTGNSGNITIVARRLNVQSGATISSSSFATGQAGDVTINARESVNLEGAGDVFGQFVGSSLTTNSQGSGNAGTLTLNTGQLTLRSGGTISVSTTGPGQDGVSRITADTVDISGMLVNGQPQIGQIANVSTGTGNGADLNISTRSLTIRDGGRINTTASGTGRGGNISILAPEAVEVRGGLPFANGSFFNSLLITGASNNATAGDLTLNTGRLTIQDRGRISTSTDGRGQGGDINITANSINITGVPQSTAPTDISSDTFATANGGRSGDIVINAGQLNLTNQALISTRAIGSGQGGDITVNADVINLADAASLTTSTAIAGGAGNLTVNANQLSIRRGANIDASTGGEGKGGDINIEADTIELIGISLDRQQLSAITASTGGNNSSGRAGNITISASRLSVQDGAAISTSTFNQGRGGDLSITARDAVVVTGNTVIATGQTVSSSIAAETRGAGRAGDLQIATEQLQIQNGGVIAASTSGSGQAGNIRIDADVSRLIGQTENELLGTGITTSVAANATGNAGNIRINGRELLIRDQAFIATSTQGQGSGGNISIQLDEDFQLPNRGFVTSSVEPGSTGDSGNIAISARSLTASGGSQISASVLRPRRDIIQQQNLQGGRGEGGNIRILATDSITLSGTQRRGFSSGILALTERDADGTAGDINIRTGDFRVANGAIVTASTFNPGNAGNIRINAENFAATGGGQVVTNTRRQGRAGTIALNVAEEIVLSGVDSNFQARQRRARRYTNRRNNIDRVSDVIVNQGRASGLFANTSGSGEGGEISVNTNDLTLRDRAAISSASRGRNQAGEAGDINITTTGTLRANNGNIETRSANSSSGNITITTDAMRLRGDSDIRTQVDQGDGRGGEIDITADSIVAYNDSDIVTRAREGRGGDIIFDTPAFFGAGYQPNIREDRDINSRVDLDASGEVSSGTVQTPNTDFIQNSLSDLPTSAINTDQLLANSCIARTETGGTFLITGTGGLPAAPGNDATSDYPTGEIRAIPSEADPDRSWQLGDPIVEPQGVYRLPDGRLVMSRECEN